MESIIFYAPKNGNNINVLLEIVSAPTNREKSKLCSAHGIPAAHLIAANSIAGRMSELHQVDTAARAVALAVAVYYGDQKQQLEKDVNMLFSVYFKIHETIQVTPKHIAYFLAAYFNSIFIADGDEISGCPKNIVACCGRAIDGAPCNQPIPDKNVTLYRNTIEATKRLFKAESYACL